MFFFSINSTKNIFGSGINVDKFQYDFLKKQLVERMKINFVPFDGYALAARKTYLFFKSEIDSLAWPD